MLNVRWINATCGAFTFLVRCTWYVASLLAIDVPQMRKEIGPPISCTLKCSEIDTYGLQKA
uniref:Uncharacterized protein n=1 Tax=Arion vulgaris TaxID=1028688 RepID=A0A0B6YGS0_9EUPU